MTDHIPLPPPDYTEDVQGFVHDTQRHYYSEETMRAYAERLHAARVNGSAIMQAIGLLTVLQSWIGPRRPEGSEPEEQALWDQIESTRIALTPLAHAGAPAVQQVEPLTHWEDAKVQTVYRVLCSDEAPAKGEHWEGWCARRIVDALAAHPTTPAAQGDAEVLSMSEALMLQRLADAENAARYALARRKIAIVNGEFRVLNLQPTGTAQYAEIEFDAAIDAARSQATQGESA